MISPIDAILTACIDGERANLLYFLASRPGVAGLEIAITLIFE